MGVDIANNTAWPASPEGRRVDRFLLNSLWCIWPECERAKLDDTHLCDQHTLYAYQYVEDAKKQRAAQLDAAEDTLNRGEELNLTDPIPGYVYFVESDGLIKIGYSTNPAVRLRHYSPGARVLAVYPGTKHTERELHNLFHFALTQGREWFRDVPEIRAHIADKVADHGRPTAYAKRYRNRDQSTQVMARRTPGMSVA